MGVLIQPPSHFEILENTLTTLAVKINPAAYRTSLIRNKRPSDFEIAFNTNFFWNAVPIGKLMDGNKVIYTYPSKGIRPTFQINQLLFEAGPQLVEQAVPVWGVSFNHGKFSFDVVRRTNHLAAGYTWTNKLIVVFKKYSTMHDLSNYLIDKGCRTGINMDGGSSASLKIGKLQRGAYKIVVGVGFSR